MGKMKYWAYLQGEIEKWNCRAENSKSQSHREFCINAVEDMEKTLNTLDLMGEYKGGMTIEKFEDS